eukprot:scaffold9857_cov127-Cylindrotheca_fusiformis.AAC.22
MSTDDDATSSLPKRRRKRKKKEAEDSETGIMEETKEDEPELDWKLRDSEPVELQVRDIREIIGGNVSSEPSSAAPNPESPTSSAVSKGGVLDPESPARASSGSSDSSFEVLLEDARRLRADSDDVDGGNDDGIKAKVRNVLSAIVTADFFVVFGFLLWFLAGIAFRAIFDDTSVQIAFNNNFELLVQPALGVLMLGTIAGNFLKDENDSD